MTYLIFSNIARYPALSADSFSINSASVISPFSISSFARASAVPGSADSWSDMSGKLLVEGFKILPNLEQRILIGRVQEG